VTLKREKKKNPQSAEKTKTKEGEKKKGNNN
jgi:hypothetical protein